jgi:hypothetical protein
MCHGIAEHLSSDDADLFIKNFSNVIKDPLTVAAVAALVHLRNKFLWGTLPKSCMPEVMALYGAGISAAVSGRSHRICDYMQTISALQNSLDKHAFLQFINQAFALGFSDKWSDQKSEARKGSGTSGRRGCEPKTYGGKKE